MNYLEFKEALLPFQVFSIKDAQKCFTGFDSRRLVEWQKKGYIIKLINKWYVFNEVQKNESLLYRISSCLSRPSYISLESAFAYYYIIPEAIDTIQAITTKKTMLYDTPLTSFNYRNIKPSLFFGYYVLSDTGAPILMAEKEKALLDYFHLNARINTEQEIAAIRLNTAGLADIDWQKFDSYLTVFDNKALNARIQKFKSFLRNNATL